MKRTDRRGNRSLKQFAVKCAVVFFAIIGILTYFSGTIEYLLLPEVTAMEPMSGKLDQDLSKEAEILYEGDKGIYSTGDLVIAEILVREGERIEAGTPVLKLNQDVLEQKKQELWLELTRVQNELESLYYEWNHFQGTQAEKNVLANSSEEKEIERNLLQSKYDCLTENIDESGNLLSPVTGMITELCVENGQAVMQGEELLRVAEEGIPLCVGFTLNDSEKKYYRKDGKFDVIYSEKTEDGTVTENTVQGSMGDIQETDEAENYSVIGKMDEESFSNLEYGDKVRVNLEFEGIIYDTVIPASAVKESEGRKVVYVLRQDEKKNYYVKRIQAAVLESGEYFAAVDLELEYGDRIITSTSKSLDDGDRVRMQS